MHAGSRKGCIGEREKSEEEVGKGGWMERLLPAGDTSSTLRPGGAKILTTHFFKELPISAKLAPRVLKVFFETPHTFSRVDFFAKNSFAQHLVFQIFMQKVVTPLA